MRNTLFCALALLTFAFASHAQLPIRTWVSGTGDDAFPCSRTAPCKTFQGAIGKTAAGGVISVMDAGGYGSVWITKSITIEGTGSLGSSITSIANGVTINAATTDVVVLRDLSLHGANSGFNGVQILQAGQVTIQNCNIQNAADGIDIVPNGDSTLTKVVVRNSHIVHNTSKGIDVTPTGTARVALVVEDSEVSGNGANGITIAGTDNSATIRASRIVSNGLNGLHVYHASSTLLADSSLIAYNQTGIQAGLGAQAPILHLSGCTITGNTINGIGGLGTVIGFSNNTIAGNGGNNSVTSSVQQQ